MKLEHIRAALCGREAELILPETARYTSVLVPLVERAGELHVLFEVRSSRIAQGGEVCFPGGHRQPGESGAEAALRETCEELLLAPEQVELVAPLHRLADRGKVVIDSYLGVLRNYADTFSPGEVSRVFTLPLRWLLDNPPEIYAGEMELRLGDDFPFDKIPGGRAYPFLRQPRRFYFYSTDEAVIWGLTGELLYRAVELLRTL